MLALALFSWWYGSGWGYVSKKILTTISRISESFSVKLLLNSLFDPWHRITTETGRGLAAHFQAAIDNTISRLVGLVVRIFVLISALLLTFILLIIGAIQLILWPLIPPAIIVCIILGFTK